MKKADKHNYTYILRCADGTLYTGWTNDMRKRLAAHNAGTAAKYTRPQSRRPAELVYLEAFETKEEAMSREYRIKQLTREEKDKLIAHGMKLKRMQKRIREVLD